MSTWNDPLSVNRLAQPLLQRLLDDASQLRVSVQRDEFGVQIVDAGLEAPGSVEAGLAIARICLGGLGDVHLRSSTEDGWPTWVEVHSAQPVLACLASQYAGWSLSATKEETGGKKFFSLGSGPARALAGRETLFEELGYRDRADTGCLVMEVDRLPPPVVVEKVLRDCALPPQGLTLIVTPTASLAGTTQVVARVLEVALHKAHELGFNLQDIVSGSACAPLPAPGADGLQAMGRTNDAILYGGRVHLVVKGELADAQRLAQQLPSKNSADHGRSFADIFKDAGYDFYKIDGALFAPAVAWVTHQPSGRTWQAGGTSMALLRGLWLEMA
ncbi:methenyltetrahydromethanopterin cyclohydrolase [Azohydromonas lata]|uniref:Methenyltetrahydromethanopterin cyclohydrolase n=1 Tax=Azohydromonas lata TaxID=45677 RepID=A0ABU5IGI3_9BURK|nr:methenyltetrahydromethanopterin cyclohydrolase [Azohydromonas lata]MDZ5458246.1 methenyltetrahydromethanopterin cyclohydrolase [Azohydromonas lata]